MYLYTHTCKQVCIFIHVYIYVNIKTFVIHTYICIYTYTHKCMYIIHVCLSLPTRICPYEKNRKDIAYIYLHAYICIRENIVYSIGVPPYLEFQRVCIYIYVFCSICWGIYRFVVGMHDSFHLKLLHFHNPPNPRVLDLDP